MEIVVQYIYPFVIERLRSRAAEISKERDSRLLLKHEKNKIQTENMDGSELLIQELLKYRKSEVHSLIRASLNYHFQGLSKHLNASCTHDMKLNAYDKLEQD